MGADQDFDTIVLGAGLSGLTAAYELSKQGKRVCVLEDFEHAGGNHRSVNVGDMTFDIGAIFFWSDFPTFEMFPELKDRCVRAPWGTVRINPQADVAAYPFDLTKEVLRRSPLYGLRVAASVIKARLAGLKTANADTFLTYYLGDLIKKESGIDSYVRRFYGVDAEQISYDFASRRMQQIVQFANVWKLLGRFVDRVKYSFVKRPAGNYCLARPKEGFSDYYETAVEQLRLQGVTFGFSAGLKSLQREGVRHIVKAGDQDYAARTIISTIPMSKAAELAGIDTDVAPVSLMMTTLCCKFRGQRGFKDMILYNFQAEGRWKRLTVHSDYYGPDGEWEYFNVETTAGSEALTQEELFQDFLRTVQQVGLLDGEVELVTHLETPFAYPLYEIDAEKKRDALAEKLESAGIDLIGRQGRFQYQPTSSITVSEARNQLKSTRAVSDPE